LWINYAKDIAQIRQSKFSETAGQKHLNRHVFWSSPQPPWLQLAERVIRNVSHPFVTTLSGTMHLKPQMDADKQTFKLCVRPDLSPPYGD